MSSTSSSNYRRNKAFIDQYRKELKAMLDDITDIDIKVLNKAVNEGVKVAKENTNVVTGFMRKSWRSAPAVKRKGGGVTKTIVNTADYASYVNYGHRIVEKVGVINSIKSKDGLKLTFRNRAYGTGVTTGFVKGQFMLEKAISHTEKTMVKEFKKEVERVAREHGS